MTMKRSKQRIKDDISTVSTEQSSVYDAILSTCCCGGSSSGQNSFKDNAKVEKNHKKKGQHIEEDIEPKRKFWERVSDVALYLIMGAPPVKIVKCFECSSVDNSEVTMPRVLSDLADEYDRENKCRVNSMWSISEDLSDSMQISALNTTSDDNMLNPTSLAASQKKLSRRIGSGRSRLRLRGSGGSKPSRSSRSVGMRSTASTAMSTTTNSSYLLKNRINGFGGDSQSNVGSKSRGGTEHGQKKMSTKSSRRSRINEQRSFVRIEI